MFQTDTEPCDPVARRQMLTVMLQDTIMMLCKNMIKYDLELSVEGLLGVTVDRKDVVLVNIKELVTAQMSRHSSHNSASNSCSNSASNLNNNSAPITASSEDSSDITLSKRKRQRVSRQAVTTTSEHEKQSTRKGREKILNGDDYDIMITIDDEDIECCGKQEDVMSDVSNVDRLTAGNSVAKLKDSDKVCQQDNYLDDDKNKRMGQSESTSKSQNSLNKDVVIRESFVNLSHVEVSDNIIPTIKYELDDGGEVDLINVKSKHSRVSSTNKSVRKSHVNQVTLSQSTSLITFSSEESINDQSPVQWGADTGGQSPVQWGADTGSQAPVPWVAETDPVDLDSICYTKRDSNGTLFHHCAVCAQSFSARHHVRRHFNSQHSCAPEHHFCEQCGAAFRRSDVLKRHVKSVHKNVLEDCSSWVHLDGE